MIRRYLIGSLIFGVMSSGGVSLYEHAQHAAASTARSMVTRELRQQARSTCRKQHSRQWCAKHASLKIGQLHSR
jgi:hypothetical protein